MRDLISFRSVLERDIDLLVLEEIHVSEAFRRFLFEKAIALPAEYSKFQGAWHSVPHATGESDLEADFITKDGQHFRLLIENKINAVFQPSQEVRYGERSQAYVGGGECAACHTLLMAPQTYLEGRPELEAFDGTLTYEELQAWFRDAGDLGERGRYRQSVITAAIEQARRGWPLVVDDPTNRFWNDYWQFAQKHAPELNMPRPTPKPEGSVWVYFPMTDVSPALKLVHKLPREEVDLQIAGMAGRLDQLRSHLEGLLEPGLTLVKTAKSAAVRAKVPKVDPKQPFSKQEASVLEGIQAAQKLRTWAKKNVLRLREGCE